MCHKPAQIDNISRDNTDTVYVTTYIGPALFSNFQKDIWHKTIFFCEIIDDLSDNYYDC